ncbi:Hypothetical protein PHPALM_37107 [Phytophthora palmivora]|uniref:Uncharacterized protein n=1 Tax=Phytophthora palmivora TaxID=4796 RepID=A0A2P4WYA6_9STRA|nr:Hypothetical protein PHPALM_37107 [Phytophthora palmivora]
MLDPKTSLAIDAPPIAPYDDGFSTDSEDFNNPEELPPQSTGSALSIHGFTSVRNAVITENQPTFQQQHSEVKPQVSRIKQESEEELRPITIGTVITEKTRLNQWTGGHKAQMNGQSKPQAPITTKIGKKKEEYCRSCKGYLTPLGERLKMMKTAGLQQFGKNPPPSRQCSCCNITYPLVALTEESRNQSCVQPRCYMCNWAVKAAVKNRGAEGIGVKRLLNGRVKDTGMTGECSIYCGGKSTPLSQRYLMMKQATLHDKNAGFPLSRQCSCGHITQSLAAFELKSNEPTWRTPMCKICEAATTHTRKTDEGMGRTTVETASSRENGSPVPTAAAAKIERKMKGKTHNKVDNRNSSNGIHSPGKMPSFIDKLHLIKTAGLQHKEQVVGIPTTCRQCYITFPLASFAEKSRSVTCATPICSSCNEASTHSLVMEDKTSVVTANDSLKEKRISIVKTKYAPETIVIVSSEEDEEGELVEEDICKCCGGKLISIGKRLQMMKNAAGVYGGKGPPPSRQCACCRITYPSAALTKKSRKMTRVVPICLNCCTAGGPAIYEMLVVSDEFVEAFKVENPTVARQLLKKKSNGTLAKAVDAQKKRIKRQVKAAQPSQPNQTKAIAK